jgi:hypothetical protein
VFYSAARQIGKTFIAKYLTKTYDAFKLEFGMNWQTVRKQICQKWYDQHSTFSEKPIVVVNMVADDQRRMDALFGTIERIQDAECFGDGGDWGGNFPWILIFANKRLQPKDFSPDRMHTFVISGEQHEDPYSLVYHLHAEGEKAVGDDALLQANDLEVEAAESGRAVELLILDKNFIDKAFRNSVDDIISKLIAHGRSVKCDFFNKFVTEKRSGGVDYEKSKFYEWVTQNYQDKFASGQFKRTTSAGKHYYSGRADKAQPKKRLRDDDDEGSKRVETRSPKKMKKLEREKAKCQMNYLVGDNAMTLNTCGQQFHCILIDPPTTIAPKQRGRSDVQEWDKLWAASKWTEIAVSAKATLMPEGSVIVFVGSQQGKKTRTLKERACKAFTDAGFNQMLLFWHKKGFKGMQWLNPHKAFGDTEILCVFSLQTDTFYKRIGQTSSSLRARQHTEHHAGMHHFKPLALYEKLLKMFVPPDGTVCDATLYTGISAVASLNCGLNFFGIDMNKDYIEQTKARMEFATKK